jgi:hypothetical protein
MDDALACRMQPSKHAGGQLGWLYVHGILCKMRMREAQCELTPRLHALVVVDHFVRHVLLISRLTCRLSLRRLATPSSSCKQHCLAQPLGLQG